MKRIKNVLMENALGLPITIGDSKEQVRVGDLICLVILSPVPGATTSMQDVLMGHRVVSAVHVAKEESSGDPLDCILVEDSDYDWLYGWVEKHGPRVLGMNAAPLFLVLKAAKEG